jgi:hypothetical protein
VRKSEGEASRVEETREAKRRAGAGGRRTEEVKRRREGEVKDEVDAKGRSLRGNRAVGIACQVLTTMPGRLVNG